MIKGIFKNKYILISIILVVLYNNFSYEGKSTALLTKYAIEYNKDFMVKNENCSEEFNELSLPLEWVIRNHKRTFIYKRDIILLFLKKYNCEFRKHGQSYEVKGNVFWGHKLGDAFANIVNIRGFLTTFEALTFLKENKKFINDELIRKELDKTYKLYEQRGMKVELPPDFAPKKN